jgi:hypothetical protein
MIGLIVPLPALQGQWGWSIVIGLIFAADLAALVVLTRAAMSRGWRPEKVRRSRRS